MNATTNPWAVFKCIHGAVTVKHFTTRARARIYAASVKQDSRATAVIRRANRKNAMKWYARLAPVLTLSPTPPVQKVQEVKKVVVLKPARRQKRAVNLTFAFMDVG